MKTDEAIKAALHKRAASYELSEDKAVDIFRYIEENGRVSRNKFSFLGEFRNLISRVEFNGFIEIALIILIAIVVPFAVRSHKNSSTLPLKHSTDLSSTQLNKEYKYNFEKELVGVVEQYVTATPASEHQSYNDINKIKDKIPFNIQYPNFIPEGYKLNNTVVDVYPSSLFTVYSVKMTYTGNGKEEIRINEISETGHPNLDSWEKTNINGIDAWVSPVQNSKSIIQIILYNNGKYYNFSCDSNGRENLIKVASSFDYSKDIIPNETIQYFDDEEQVKVKLPYEAKFPTYMPSNFKKSRTFLTIKNVGNDELYILNTTYNAENNDGITITEVNETINPKDIFNKYKTEINKHQKINLKGTDAWVYEGSEKLTEVIFYKDGRYYMISGMAKYKDEFIKIAASI